MQKYNTDELRLLAMAVASNIVTVLVLGGIVQWSAELTAGIMASINSILILLAYIIKPTGSTGN